MIKAAYYLNKINAETKEKYFEKVYGYIQSYNVDGTTLEIGVHKYGTLWGLTEISTGLKVGKLAAYCTRKEALNSLDTMYLKSVVKALEGEFPQKQKKLLADYIKTQNAIATVA